MSDIEKKIQPDSVDSKKQPAKEIPFEDERYPGSFFKIPGVPRPGKTAWRIT